MQTGLYTDSRTAQELFDLVLGKELGAGMSRRVFECKLDPSLVVKFEPVQDSSQNVREWLTWKEVYETEFKRWFAPCVHCSTDGRVLFMKRTETPRREEYPEKMPVFLTDHKFQNYGMLDGQLVCHDYGTNLLMTHGLTKRMRKAEWWDSQA